MDKIMNDNQLPKFRNILAWVIIFGAVTIAIGIFSVSHPEYKANSFINEIYTAASTEFGSIYGVWLLLVFLIYSTLLLASDETSNTKNIKTVIISISISYGILVWLCLGLYIYNIDYNQSGKMLSLMLNNLTGEPSINKILYAIINIATLISFYFYYKNKINNLRKQYQNEQ